MLFFKGGNLIASMDIFQTEKIYEEIFDFKHTEPVTPKFDFSGINDKNFTNNSGSLYPVWLLIFGEYILRQIINRISLMCSRMKVARGLRSLSHYENPYHLR